MNKKLKNLIRHIYHIYEDLRYGDILEKNKSLKNLYEGHRCFILGTGVSLNSIDVIKLSNEYTFCCNFLFRHKDFSRLKLSFFASIPPIWTMRFKAKDLHPKNYFSTLEACCLNNNIKFFLHSSCKYFIDKNKFLKEHDIYYLKFSDPMELASIQSNDLTKRITFKDGVFFFMVAAAIYMGFKELYLCGCGYTYQPRQEFYFYDEPSFSKEIPKDERTKMIKEFAKAHGVEIYKIKEEDLYDKPILVRNIPVDKKNQIIKEFAESNYVKIYNITPDGFESPVYEKVTWEYILENILQTESS
jgi:hypothetical protein